MNRTESDAKVLKICKIAHNVRYFLKNPIVIITIIGLIIRLVIGIFLNYGYDVYHWGTIIQNYESGNGLYGLDGYYYTPGWGYILGVISSFQNLLGVDVIGERILEYLPIENYTEWFLSANATTIAFNITLKLAIFICDIVVGYLIYWIIMDITHDKKKGTIAYALWFLCPFVITIAAVEGMFDTFSTLMTLLCIIFLMKDRYFLAGMMFCMAMLTKFFPGILIFVLIAYVLLKHKDNIREGLRCIIYAAMGVVITGIVMFFPQIMENDIMVCFSFLTSRASTGLGGELGAIGGTGTIIAYLAIIIISIIIAIHVYKSPKENADKTLLSMIMINIAVIFLYPSTPQYMVLIVPFLAMYIVMYDKQFIKPWIVLAIGTTLFSLSGNFTDLMSIGAFTNILSTQTVMDLSNWFQEPIFGLSKMGWIYYSGAILQYAGTVLILWTYFKDKIYEYYHKSSKITDT